MEDNHGSPRSPAWGAIAGAAFGAALVVSCASVWLIGAPLSLPALLLQSLAIGTVTVVVLRATTAMSPRSATATEHSPRARAARPDLDPTTFVLNEQSITVKLLELIALGERYGNKLSVAILGVDHLRHVNETYGRGVGDVALRTIATALAETIRMPDRVGRHGDDRFLVILPETDIHGARQIAERLRSAVSKVAVPATQDTEVGLTVSIGVSAYRRGDDLQSLLSRATKAMTQAKLLGRNRVLTDLAA